MKRSLALMLVLTCARHACAVEDTDTPGAGRWEINLSTSAARNAGSWEIAAPDTDFNYGWGEHAQLALALPRVELRESGKQARSAMGTATAGLKWRFAEQEQVGYALALFPSVSWNPSSATHQLGLAEPGASVALPLIVGRRDGNSAWFAEARHSWAQQRAREWLGGLKVTTLCGAGGECRLELQHARAAGQAGQTHALVGLKWPLAPTLLLQAAIGRDIGAAGDDKRQLAFKVGIQLLR